MYKEIIVEDMEGYIQKIKDIRLEIINNGGYISDTQRFFFRGQLDEKWDVIPSLFRNEKYSESELIYQARLRNPLEFKSFDCDFECLTKLQHYGLPTRLLDVTTNPLVALYFACETDDKDARKLDETDDKDACDLPNGAVYFNQAYCMKHDGSEVATISHLSTLDIQWDMTLDKCLEELIERGILSNNTIENLECNYRSLIDTLQQNYFVIPSFNNERLIRQSGAFLLFGQYTISQYSDDVSSCIIQKASGSLRKEFKNAYFKIPYDCKKDILETLDGVNVNEASLFPELEHQMKYIKNMQKNYTGYTPLEFIPFYEKSYKKRNNEIIEYKVDKDISKKIFGDVLRAHLGSKNDVCLKALMKNSVVDWFNKEHKLASMRVDLTNALVDSGIDKTSAKKMSSTIINEILNRVREL